MRGGFNHPDTPNRITITDTQKTTFETPGELTKYLGRLGSVRNILSNGGSLVWIAGALEFAGGLIALRPDIVVVGAAAIVVGLSSGMRSDTLSQRLRAITDRLKFTSVNYLQVIVDSGNPPPEDSAEKQPPATETVNNGSEGLAPSATSV